MQYHIHNLTKQMYAVVSSRPEVYREVLTRNAEMPAYHTNADHQVPTRQVGMPPYHIQLSITFHYNTDMPTCHPRVYHNVNFINCSQPIEAQLARVHRFSRPY